MKVFTIGFTKTSAEHFFGRILASGAKRIIDVRLNNKSQLAGFAKRDDLKYFLREIGNVDYVHEPMLAPSQEILDELKKRKGSWASYEQAFMGLMRERRIEDKLDPELLSDGCLLCSEAKPHHCHRRLVLEYLDEAWAGCQLEVVHL